MMHFGCTPSMELFHHVFKTEEFSLKKQGQSLEFGFFMTCMQQISGLSE